MILAVSGHRIFMFRDGIPVFFHAQHRPVGHRVWWEGVETWRCGARRGVETHEK